MEKLHSLDFCSLIRAPRLIIHASRSLKLFDPSLDHLSDSANLRGIFLHAEFCAISSTLSRIIGQYPENLRLSDTRYIAELICGPHLFTMLVKIWATGETLTRPEIKMTEENEWKVDPKDNTSIRQHIEIDEMIRPKNIGRMDTSRIYTNDMQNCRWNNNRQVKRSKLQKAKG